MAHLRIILEDDNGREMTGAEGRAYAIFLDPIIKPRNHFAR